MTRNLRLSVLAATSLCLLPAVARADEGMWTFNGFPADRVQKSYGFAPDQAWLDHARLASVRLAQGCSASFVSASGLVMTNHHCARECTDGLSTAAHDYVKEGFLAKTEAEERRCPALEANQLVAITDVTRQIHDATKDLAADKFRDAERAAITAAEETCGHDPATRCEVVSLYNGGIYNLYRYHRYQDLRLVWSPEDAAANFGGDPDNFSYPRYAVDAAFVRVYDHGHPLASPDFFPLRTTPAAPDELVFVSGNPGRTSRLDTVSELEFDRDVALPFLVQKLSELRGVFLLMQQEGGERERIALSDLFFDENSLKAIRGMEKALVDGTLIRQKADQEAAFRARVDADPDLKASTGGAWGAIDAAVAHERTIFTRYQVLERLPNRSSDLLADAIRIVRNPEEAAKPNGQRLLGYTEASQPALRQFVLSPAPLYPALEIIKLTWLFEKMREELTADDPVVRQLLGDSSPQQLAEQIVHGTRLFDVGQRQRLLDGGAAALAAVSDDPLIAFVRRLDPPARAVRHDYETNVEGPITSNTTKIAAARFKLEGTSTYPDATFTARLTYGTVKGYVIDGKPIPPFTTYGGAFARQTGAYPFKLPDSWLAARRAIPPDTHLDFASTTDIIGGNSGSPVIDKSGRAVGLIFDGNIQSLGSDYGFDAAVNRAVAVDATGLREALTRIYHADRIADELNRAAGTAAK